MNKTYFSVSLVTLAIYLGFSISGSDLFAQAAPNFDVPSLSVRKSVHHEKLELIRPDTSNSFFIGVNSGKKFMVWGFNYDHDTSGRLIEDYWFQDWDKVERDFEEMKKMGANVVRIHLQFPKFMKSADLVNVEMLTQLKRLLGLAERVGMYLDITGLGCYHKNEVPEWYDALNEEDRWAAQCLFWEAISKTCEASPSIFCYDLMNEPILPGDNKPETEWLLGELGRKYFIQRITLNLAGRNRYQVAKAWVDKLVAAIRKYDSRHMITIGEIPWAYTFPGAKPLFYSDSIGKNLDFVSVHFYPKKGDIANALIALNVYKVGKPIVIEEMFPLLCSLDELDTFIDSSRNIASGWIGFYWGRSLKDFQNQNNLDMTEALIKGWLEYFQGKSKRIIETKK